MLEYGQFQAMFRECLPRMSFSDLVMENSLHTVKKVDLVNCLARNSVETV